MNDFLSLPSFLNDIVDRDQMFSIRGGTGDLIETNDAKKCTAVNNGTNCTAINDKGGCTVVNNYQNCTALNTRKSCTVTTEPPKPIAPPTPTP